MSAGPGPPKSPAPHPPRRGHSVTAGRLTRYRNLREHKSVLDFGRDWRDWDVDIFQDDDTVSSATTETGTATSISICIGIAVDDEQQTTEQQQLATAAAQTPARNTQQQQQQQQRGQTTPSSAARRRTAPALTLQPPPQTPLQLSRPQSHWQWPDVGVGVGFGAFEDDDYDDEASPSFLGRGTASCYYASRSNLNDYHPYSSSTEAAEASVTAPPCPESPVRFSYPNRRRPKTAPNAAESPLQGGSAAAAAAPPPPPPTAPPPNVPPPPPPPNFLPPPLPLAARVARDSLPPPLPQLRPRSHNPILVSNSSSCADLKLSARADHARSQIITKLNLHPVPSREQLRDAEWEKHRQQQHQLQQQIEQEEEDDRRRKDQEQEEATRWAEEVARLEAETDRILAEQKRKDLARLQAQLAAVPDPPPRRSPIVNKFAFFLRKSRKSDSATLTKSPPTYFQPLSLDCRPVSVMDPTRFIQAGGGGIVPQTDAPITASNAGERRVTIRCMQSSISLPVTPETTPMEILYSAANLMTQNINPQTSIVMECYFAFGLERRLRRYERVRDVLNSWDRDSQHCLLIIPGDSVDKNPDLNVEVVPRTIDPPAGLINFLMYHSSRPGKWNKRYITLKEDGQVFSAKKKDAKVSDKDSLSLCHLSDFDLYSVTEKDMLKQIRAPKKNTFAVKSQQKSSVFQNTENFIHFFSTDDARLAEDFKRVLHSWRSWYLVNKKVDLSKPKKTSRSPNEKPSSGLARSGTLHRLKVSVDETPYTIGTFSPLLDMEKLEKSIDDIGREPEKHSMWPAEQLSVPKQQKVVSRSRTTPNLASPMPRKHIDPFARDQEFRNSGLLGRAYEGRKQQAEKNAAAAAHEDLSPDSPFTGGLLTNYPEPEMQTSGQLSGMPARRGTPVPPSRRSSNYVSTPDNIGRTVPEEARDASASGRPNAQGPRLACRLARGSRAWNQGANRHAFDSDGYGLGKLAGYHNGTATANRNSHGDDQSVPASAHGFAVGGLKTEESLDGWWRTRPPSRV
ncbi:hypothetical protein COL26b_000234 [Colletotrichum chrysophilum]|uniref:uncharacterized protein n=1 Tax=Colletotrichum chrysophilum TaxID=1836956 RepID=UPI002301593C|nr:uncharacterized protein COL26b_000234 [Colletotrichum chrysophilum]KAJ0381556.1 hypothetical protein COL26b_000234 [Colletotrichum chrysophilum]